MVLTHSRGGPWQGKTCAGESRGRHAGSLAAARRDEIDGSCNRFGVRPLSPPSTAWSVSAAVLLLVIGTWGAIQAGLSGADFMDDLEVARPPLTHRPAPVVDAGTTPLAERVVIAVVDGLRVDVSRKMPFLDELRHLGVDAIATSGYPTWSRPNYVNILTGVPPPHSGVRTNRYRGAVTLDSLMDRVRARGLRAGFASDYDPVPRLFLRPRGAQAFEVDVTAMDDGTAEAWMRAIRTDLRGDFDDPRYAPWPGGFREASEFVLTDGDPLAVLLIGAVDAAGHEWGGESDEYVAAAFEADAALRAAVARLDFSRDALIVVADHGHTRDGGHGGLEPEVVEVPFILVGKGITPGAEIRGASLSDVAPTAAALLGLPAPAHGLGRTRVEALALAPDARDRIVAADRARIERNLARVHDGLGGARAQRLGRRALRVAVVLAVAAAAGLMAWWLRRRGGMRLDLRVLLVGAPAFFIVYYTLIGVLGQRFSPSLLPDSGHIGLELVKYGAIGTIVHLGVGWFALRRRLTLADRLAAANGIAWLGLVLAMVPAGLLWAIFPAPYLEVPAPRLLVLIPAVKVAIACYAVAVALSLLLEVIVFFSRAVDPRVRVSRLERAMARAREQAERRRDVADRGGGHTAAGRDR